MLRHNVGELRIVEGFPDLVLGSSDHGLSILFARLGERGAEPVAPLLVLVREHNFDAEVCREDRGHPHRIEEILQLPEAEQEAAVTIVGGTFAAPGETGSGTAVLDTPGSYALICLIPQGMTSVEQSGAALDGPPHVSLGMWAAFTVT